MISLVPLVQLQHVAHERATTISIIKATECNLSAVTSRLSIWVITQLSYKRMRVGLHLQTGVAEA